MPAAGAGTSAGAGCGGEALERPRRVTGLDGAARQRDACPNVLGSAGREQRHARVEEQHVEARTALAAREEIAHQGRGGREVAGAQLPVPCRTEPELAGMQRPLRDGAVTDLGDQRRCPERALVQPVHAVHHHGMHGAEPCQRLRHRPHEARLVHPHHLAPRARGVRERPEEVEDGREPERLAHRHDVAGGRVVVHREAEADPGRVHAAALDVAPRVHVHAQGRKHLGAPAAGAAAVAVLGHPSAGGRRDDGSGRRDVEELRTLFGYCAQTGGIRRLESHR